VARERYLVGVSDEELQPNAKPEGPKTPKGKWENYWYHHKWHTVAGVSVVAVLAVFIHQMATKPKYDYTIIVAIDSYVGESAQNRLRIELENCGRDLNGDGEVKVALDVLNMNMTGADPQMLQANQTKLMANFQMGDVMLYVFDEPTYKARFGKTADQEAIVFFAPIGLENADISPEWNYWNWINSPLRNEPEMLSSTTNQMEFPKDLYFGVRQSSGTAAKHAQKRDECLELLQNFITGTAQIIPIK